MRDKTEESENLEKSRNNRKLFSSWKKKSLIKLAESLDLSRLEDECIILEDEKADDIYGGKFVCWGNYNNCSFGNCS